MALGLIRSGTDERYVRRNDQGRCVGHCNRGDR